MKRIHLFLPIFITLLFTVWAFRPVSGQEKYVPSQEEIDGSMQFSGISGPGKPVLGNGWGRLA